MLVKEFDVGITTKEPKKFDDNPLPIHLFGCEEREPVLEVMAELVAEKGLSSRHSFSGRFLVRALVKGSEEELVVLFHERG